MISEKKYNDLMSDMKYNLQVRIDLVKFSFTTVLATFALSFAKDSTPHIVFLIPFVILTIFNCKISQYRMWHAEMLSFIRLYDSDLKDHEKTAINLQRNFIDKFILAVVRSELCLMCAMCAIVFYTAYDGIDMNIILIILYLSLPIIFIVLNFFITSSTYRYDSLTSCYTRRWLDKIQKLK